MSADVPHQSDVVGSSHELAPKKPKKPYSPPKLVEHGTLTELAQKQGSADAGAMSNVIRSFQAFVHTGGNDASAPAGRRS